MKISCNKKNRDKHKTEELIKKAEEQKKELIENKEFQSSIKKVEKSQKKILKENPDLVKDLLKLKESLGTDGKYDQALLADILRRTKQLGQDDPRIRSFLKQQEKKLAEDSDLENKLNKIAKDMTQQRIQVS